MDAGSHWAGRMTSEAAVSSSPAVSKSPAKGDYYWLRSFVAGGRTSPSSLCAHLSASDCCQVSARRQRAVSSLAARLYPREKFLPAACFCFNLLDPTILALSHSYTLSVSSLVGCWTLPTDRWHPCVNWTVNHVQEEKFSNWFSCNVVLVTSELSVFLFRRCRMLCQDYYRSSGQSQDSAPSPESTLQTSW